MADGSPTTNYGWTKPVIGASDDVWGNEWNTNLDGIDAVVHGIDTRAIPGPSSSAPVMDGTASAGSATTWSRGDHVHPTDTTRYAASNPAGYVTAAAIPAPYVLPVASTTVLGGVKVDGTTIKAAGDGTISTTVVPMGDNRIINGDMRIDQRNNGVSGTAAGYTVDRWQYAAAQVGKGTWSRAAFYNTIGFPYALSFASSSAYASIATDYFVLLQVIEADMVSDFAWGTSNAQPVTLSFWVQSSLTGTFGGSVKNFGGTRSYPFSFSVLTAGSPTKIVITIPGDTSGSWPLSGNTEALRVCFDLGSGTTNRGPAGAWAAANYFGATGTVSVVATNGAQFYVTGVKLETGSVATPFNRQSLAKSMADCQRYYQGTNQMIGSIQANAANQVVYNSTNLPVTMRATPTMTVANSSSANLSAFAIGAYNGTAVYFQGTAVASGPATMSYTYTASAEL